MQTATRGGPIDNLTYTYNGNQLTKVKDDSGVSIGFSDAVDSPTEYGYDENGNMVYNENKKIYQTAPIQYNFLNLP